VKNSPTLGTSNSYVASTLRKDFHILFVIYIPNTPVGCTNVNSFELIKSKGNLAFPRKPSHPRGLLRGASPQKWSHFFAKNRKHAKYDSTRASGEFRRGTSGQAGKTHESEIAYSSGRIQPFSLASGPAGYSWNRTSPAQIRLGGGKERQNSVTREIKSKYSNLQTFKIF
jgi:hypothetical protein